MKYFAVEFPEKWKKPRFVETVSGAFTIQIDYEGLEFTEDDRLKLARLTKQVLENLTTEPVEQYQKLPSATASH